ncbi:protein kinase domain-containing protein [Paenibacillus sp. YYML68]|uniref:serine/threonine protein kinase n=1 Tax=Paenibacillus sp. YYML68 TaxID=2909250 RepID=UPI00249258E6|nr:serine/threonine protein kinase [Paenibacillus sp. YYML68]
MTTSYKPSLPTGAIVTGTWNGNRYVVERLLGEGANGKVYLVRRGSKTYALKLGFDTVDHQSEVNALKSIARASEFRKHWIEADDLDWQGKTYPFSVMSYIKGKPLHEFIRDNGTDWMYVIGLNLLRKLTQLHACGYIFGDLKPENVLLTSYGEVELIDFGGVTAKGRSVKQFTEAYDRGYWNAGGRVADEAYDLFAFAALLVHAAGDGRRFEQAMGMLPQTRSSEGLVELVSSTPPLRTVEPILRQALTGRYDSSRKALADWRARSVHAARPAQPVRKQHGGWIQVCFTASVVLFAAAMYFAWP